MIDQHYSRLVYYIVIYILIVTVLGFVDMSYALGVSALSIFLVPIAAWRIHKIKNSQKITSLRSMLFFLTLNIIFIFAWFISAICILFVLALNPWPISEYQHYTVKQDLLERGFIPPTAINILVKDDHGGLHGDGSRVVTYEYVGNSVDELPPLNIRADKAIKWQSTPFDKGTLNTLGVLEYFDIPSEYRPDMSSLSLRYYCNNHCNHLYIYDWKEKRFWYINITD